MAFGYGYGYGGYPGFEGGWGYGYPGYAGLDFLALLAFFALV